MTLRIPISPDEGRSFRLVIMVSAMLTSGCGEDPAAPGQPDSPLLSCSIDQDLIAYGGVARDGIPSLQDPVLVGPFDPGSEYVRPSDRVIGIQVDGQYIAIPHNLLWWHEIVNFDGLGVPLAVTYCPLTGSSMVFDRSMIDGNELGVSGLLFQNNLIMFNRTADGTTESLFPQMAQGARCGPLDGQALAMYPAVEMEWAVWRSLHSDTRVVSVSDIGGNRDYQSYPYFEYEDVDGTLFPQDNIDRRRSPKERVLGIVGVGDSGLAFPFGALAVLGERAIVHETVGSQPVVVFWNGSAQSAIAFRPTIDEQTLTFEASATGYIDVETGSTWTLDGLALTGALAGRRLELFPEAFVSFWFAWAAFHPDTSLWLP